MALPRRWTERHPTASGPRIAARRASPAPRRSPGVRPHSGCDRPTWTQLPDAAATRRRDRTERPDVRIAIDARELVGQPTGVGRYLAELLAAWSDLAGAHTHEFVLCAPEPVRLQWSLRTQTMTAAGSGTVWEQVTLPRL